ncbi:MAG: DUF6106 family protein [Oscillospiraceae bacterium]|nr:DUF6106 family protein [Oscillospiraceae bacterium]MDD4413690.1 DUF6106 family protein [Oscillospiraceae bacterium]
MDTFVEQIIAKKKSAKDYAVIFGSITFAFLVMFFALPYLLRYLGFLAVLLFFGIGYGLWWLLTSLNIEYEYSVTNGDIDIDQITAKRKRKRIVSVSGTKIESLEPYTTEQYLSRQFDRRVIAAPSENVPDLWCFTYRSRKSGHTLVVFQPEQRVLDALKSGLSNLVLRETNKKIEE